MPERVRVALIGAGRIGQRHAATLASAIPRAELAMSTGRRRRRWRPRFAASIGRLTRRRYSRTRASTPS